MKRKESRRARGSSSSGPTAVSPLSVGPIQLGKNLVNELKLHDSTDTLGRWMAHHVAELIIAAETARPKDKPARMRACREAILDLWQHRYELPDGKRPFKELEPIFRALESLDPDNPTARYYRGARPPHDEMSGESKKTREWLGLADGFDYTARLLLGFCLQNAASAALRKSAEWVVAAETAGATEGFEGPFLRIVSNDRDLLTGEKLDEVTLNAIKKRIERLDAFTQMVTLLRNAFKEQLGKEEHRLSAAKAASGAKQSKTKRQPRPRRKKS